ncbi:hypothetical protein HMPREF9945_00688 [Clostridioides difficile 70-100-2010]|nr:hypothetical protein HMPREF9945_00688 [Clostridioides difficile 70-100-2010]
MECKSEKVLFFFNVTNRFILTIWNVNKLFPKKSLFLSTSFILTIWNVNITVSLFFIIVLGVLY